MFLSTRELVILRILLDNIKITDDLTVTTFLKQFDMIPAILALGDKHKLTKQELTEFKEKLDFIIK